MKKIIYIVVIVIALGGAIVMGYMAFFGADSNTSSSLDTGSTSPTSSSPVSILPYGDRLDFSSLKKYNRANIIFPYPKVNLSEIGKGIGQIMQ